MNFIILSFAIVDARLDVPSFGPTVPMHRAGYNGTVHNDEKYQTPSRTSDPLQVGLKFASEHTPSQDGMSFVLKSHSRSMSTGITHLYLKQTYNGVEIFNGDMNVNVDKLGRVISFGSSFYDGDVESSTGLNQQTFMVTSFVSPIDAVRKLGEYLKFPESELPPSSPFVESSFGSLDAEIIVTDVPFAADSKATVSQKYLIVPSESDPNTLKLQSIYDIVTELKSDNYLNVQLDVSSGTILQLNDWVKDAKYFVYPIGVNDPQDGQRKLVVDPENKDASPLGWHNQGNGLKFKDTRGNNAICQNNPKGKNKYKHNYRPKGVRTADGDLEFNFPLDLKKEPSSYIDAAITNLFYWNNIMHDIFYLFGFDEQSGNFQYNNFNRGGRDSDPVIANAQDGSGTNNANFMTPPDGQSPRMRMYVWTQTTPHRDGDLESGIIIHEYGHGISIRLTGGPANVNCLRFGEAGGMGEGWGDFWAVALRMHKSFNSSIEFGMGEYSANRGIRPYPYSTNMRTNPFTYGALKTMKEVHAYGSVWATFLYDIYWLFVEKYGFDENWYSVKSKRDNGDQLSGNQMILGLVVDGLKLQPCNPTFVDARDAILQADENTFDGQNKCLLWKGFARRGLGLKARQGGNESFDVPGECQ